MTGNLGRFCFHRRKTVVLVWFLMLVAGVASAGLLLSSLGSAEQRYAPESVRAANVLAEEGTTGGQVVAIVEGVPPESPRLREALTATETDLRGLDGVAEVADPIPASDGSGVAVIVLLANAHGDGDAEAAALGQVTERLRGISAAVPGTDVRIGGKEVLDSDLAGLVADDLSQAELRAIPITILVLLVVFGGIAAGVPLLGTFVTMAGAFIVLFGLSNFVSVTGNVIEVIILLGLGLSIDYGLLLVARYREELVPEYRAASARGTRVDERQRLDALVRTWNTAGRTVAFSAVIIVAALCGLLLLRVTTLQMIAAGGISVALVAMVSALTLGAALLGIFGRWVHPSRRSLAAAAEVVGAPGSERGFFAGIARFTQRRPALIVAALAALLLAAGSPLLGANLRTPNRVDVLPAETESVGVSADLAARYGRTVEPAITVVARTTPDRLDAWANEWRGDPAIAQIEPAQAAGRQLSTVNVLVRGDAQGTTARELVDRMRGDRPAGVESWVTGQAASLNDIFHTLRDRLPWALLLTLSVMFVLLFLMTGSVVAPVTTIGIAVVSLGATFGAMTLIFQEGHLSGPLDTLVTGAMNPLGMPFVFAFAFGLSMDYEVFLLARCKEYVDNGFDTRTAIRLGLRHTGRIITSAALLMLIVFGSFGMARQGDVEQVGIGMFVAVLVDATLVRCLLVPAAMTMLGRWNWWAPRPLRWLHARVGAHFDHSAREFVPAMAVDRARVSSDQP